MYALVAFLIAAAGPPGDDTAEAPVIQRKLKACGHSVGPVRFLWEAQAGAPAKPALAFACAKDGKSTLLVYAPLPSGQYGLVCDSAPVVGVVHSLEAITHAARTLIYLQSLSLSPDEQRVAEALFQPRWGKCTIVAQSDLRHPEDGAVLREPKGGIEHDEDGFDVLDRFSRLSFRTSPGVGPKKSVVMAQHGKRYELGKDGKWASTEISLEAFETIPHTLDLKAPVAIAKKLAVAMPKSLVRGVRVRYTGEGLRIMVGDAVATLSAKATQWSAGPKVFGAGVFDKSDAKLAREGLVLFDPPLEAQEMELEGQATLELLTVFKDGEDWPLFEAHEDFGEQKDP
jgi:hypothetical protein